MDDLLSYLDNLLLTIISLSIFFDFASALTSYSGFIQQTLKPLRRRERNCSMHLRLIRGDIFERVGNNFVACLKVHALVCEKKRPIFELL